MNDRMRSIFWPFGMLVIWVLISSCGLIPNTTAVGDTRTETQTVELGSASEVRVRIRMNAGELTVAGDANNLMDGTFRYNVVDWQPRVSYTIKDNQGELVVDHQGEAIPVGRTLINDWSMQLNNNVPIDLDIATGAGESELDLHGLDLTDLHIETGAGNTNVDLSGVLDHDLTVTINGGVGELSVKLPGEMGVRVSAGTGIGSLTSSGLVQDGDVYVNAAYGSSPHTLFVDIQAGVGSIRLAAP